MRVRLTPKSSLDAIEGIAVTSDGPALRVRVRAVPAEGKANEALERLVAEWLGVPRSRVKVTSGGKSRVKLLQISGDPKEIVERLEIKVGQPGR